MAEMRNFFCFLMCYMTLFTAEVKQYRMIINYLMFWKAYNFLLRKHMEDFFNYKAVSQYSSFSPCVCKFVHFLLML